MGCGASSQIIPVNERPLSDAEQLACKRTLAILESLLAQAKAELAKPPAATNTRLPVISHDERAPSGERGLSLAALRAVRTFYAKHGGLKKEMGSVCKQAGFNASVCSLTHSTGLSLAETIELEAKKDGLPSDGIVGRATSFFSYSWTGTKLVDMLGSVDLLVAELETQEASAEGGGKQPLGKPRYMWVDMFAASQNLLAGAYRHPDITRETDLPGFLARKEDTDRLFDGGLEACHEMFFYASPLMDEWEAPPHDFLEPDKWIRPERFIRKGPSAITRAWVSSQGLHAALATHAPSGSLPGYPRSFWLSPSSHSADRPAFESPCGDQCLFELTTGLSLGHTLHFALSPEDHGIVAEIIVDEFDGIVEILAGIDAHLAQVSKVEDRAYILGRVAQLPRGLGTVNAEVSKALRAWFIKTGFRELNRMPKAKRGTSELLQGMAELLCLQEQHVEALALAREALEACREMKGGEHSDTIDAMVTVSDRLGKMGLFGEKLPMDRETVRLSTKKRGRKHECTMASMSELADSMMECGEREQAIEMHRELVALSVKARGRKHANSVASLIGLADALAIGRQSSEMQDLAESVPIYRECLDTLRAKQAAQEKKPAVSLAIEFAKATVGRNVDFDVTEEDVCGMMSSLGAALTELGDEGGVTEGVTLLSEAYSTLPKLKGARHPATSDALCDYAFWCAEWNDTVSFGEETGGAFATRVLREELETARELYGDDDSAVHDMMLSSCDAAVKSGVVTSESEALARTAFDRTAAKWKGINEKHPRLMEARSTLANVLCDRGKFTDAGTVLKDALAYYTRIYGASHFTTLESEAVAARIADAEVGGSQNERLRAVVGRMEDKSTEHPTTRRHVKMLQDADAAGA